MKHLAKAKKCNLKYEGSEELQSFKDKAAANEKRRLRDRYQFEKDARAEKYIKDKREYQEALDFAKKHERYLKSKDDLIDHQRRWLSDIIIEIESWKKSENCRGATNRENIEKLKQSNDSEVQHAMTKIEKFISAKISEVEKCFEEVKEEVSDCIGHYEFDEEDPEAWCREYRSDDDFIDDVFVTLRYHINEEMADLHVTVLQVLYDNAVKVGVRIKPSGFEGDEQFCEPKRVAPNINGRWGLTSVPRNVILKIPNEYHVLKNQ